MRKFSFFLESIKINNNWKKERKEKFTLASWGWRRVVVVEREIESEEGTFFLTHSAGFETCVLLTYVKIINFFRSSSSLQFILFFCCTHNIYERFHFTTTLSYGHDLLLFLYMPASFATHTLIWYFMMNRYSVWGFLIENLSRWMKNWWFLRKRYKLE